MTTDLEKRTSFEIVRSAIVEEDDLRFVEIDFTTGQALGEAQEYIRLRVCRPQDDDPRIAEALLEALRIVRNAIGDETARLTRTVDQAR